MQEINIINEINYVGNWIIHHQQVLLKYIINSILSIIITILGFYSSQKISNTFHKVLKKKNIDTTISNFLTLLFKYIIIILTLTVALEQLGVKAASVIAILGAAGMTIGLALQSSLSNFSAGLLLIIFSPFRVGEYVVVKEIAGTVINVHLFYTILKTYDGKIIVIPNGQITDNNIINFSREPCRRHELTVYIDHSENIDVVIQVLKQAIYLEPRILKNKDITVGLNQLTPYCMEFVIRCWSNTNIFNSVHWDLMKLIKKKVDENNISMPCPKLKIEVNKNNSSRS